MIIGGSHGTVDTGRQDRIRGSTCPTLRLRIICSHVDECGLKTKTPSPSVGIFWLIPSAGKAVLFTQRSALSDAESYGDCLTHPVGHYELRERLQALPFLALKKRGLPVEIKSTEYEHYPRGRVVYEKPSETFVIYADARLQVP